MSNRITESLMTSLMCKNYTMEQILKYRDYEDLVDDIFILNYRIYNIIKNLDDNRKLSRWLKRNKDQLQNKNVGEIYEALMSCIGFTSAMRYKIRDL